MNSYNPLFMKYIHSCVILLMLATSSAQAESSQEIKNCSDVDFSLKSCTPIVCKQETDIGLVTRSIIGKTESNECRYTEETKDISMMDCLFGIDKVAQAEDLLQKKYKSFKEPSLILTDEETRALGEIYQKFCSLESASKPTSLSGIIAPNPTEANTSPSSGTSEGSKNEASNQNATTAVIAPSIAFNYTEIQNIEAAIRAYESRSAGAKIGNSTLGGKDSFYLNSILHLEDNSWRIWLNNAKIERKSVMDNLSIENIGDNAVEFKWRVNGVDQLFPGWRARSSAIDENRFKINEYPIEVELTQSDTQYIYFALQINQSFIGQELKIIEGQQRMKQ